MLRRSLPLAAALVTVSPALAAPQHIPPVKLAYIRGIGAEACPDAAALREKIDKEMGYDVFELAGATRPQQLDVSIERRTGELIVSMALRNEDGELVWESSTMRSRYGCATLVDAVALAIAVRLDPGPEADACPVCPTAPECPAVPACPKPEARLLPPAPRMVVLPEPVRPSGPIGFFGAGLLGAAESPFALAPGASIFGGVRWPSVSLAVEARAVFPGTRDDQGERIDTTSFAAVIAPCAHFGPALGAAGAGFRGGFEQHLSKRLVLRAHADVLGTLVSGRQAQIVLPPHAGMMAIWTVPAVVGVMSVDLAVLFAPASLFDAPRIPSASSTPGSVP